MLHRQNPPKWSVLLKHWCRSVSDFSSLKSKFCISRVTCFGRFSATDMIVYSVPFSNVPRISRCSINASSLSRMYSCISSRRNPYGYAGWFRIFLRCSFPFRKNSAAYILIGFGDVEVRNEDDRSPPFPVSSTVWSRSSNPLFSCPSRRIFLKKSPACSRFRQPYWNFGLYFISVFQRSLISLSIVCSRDRIGFRKLLIPEYH